MVHFEMFCMLVAVIAIIVTCWEFFAFVGSCLILYVCGYLLASYINPEIEINYRVSAQEYVKTSDQLALWSGENEEEKAKLIKQRDELVTKMRQWIIEKELWKKYDRENEENGIELAMKQRIAKEEKTIRKRQKKGK